MGHAVRGAGVRNVLWSDFQNLPWSDQSNVNSKKKAVKTERPYNTAVYILRCLEAGIHISDLDFFEVGEIYDILTEHANDHEHYDQLADQEFMDRF